MNDIWSLIEKGEFEKACKETDIEYERTGDTFQLNNKISALMHLKRYENAITLIYKIISLKKEAHPSFDLSSSSYFIRLGIAQWALDKKYEAIELWQEGESCAYQDASGGISLFIIEYFAAVRICHKELKKNVVRKIKKKLKNKQALNWPGPLGRYLLCDISEVEMLTCVSTTPTLRERNLCQANFAAAIKELESGNIVEYKNRLKACIQDGALAYLEDMYYLAKAELEKLEAG